MRRWLARCPRQSTELRRTWPPFTGWQNDLHLILGVDHGLYHRLLSDLATLITAATRAISGAYLIGSCEDRSGYVYCRVPH